MAPARADAPLPDLRARYVMRRAQHTEHLELVRQGNRIVHRFAERGYYETWKRDARGQLEHVRAFPSEGSSVHYTPGDLRTIGLWPTWDSLASLLSERERLALTAAGDKRSFQRQTARMLKGRLRGQPAQLEWLDSYALPARMTIGEGDAKLVVELVELESCDASSCSVGSPTGLRAIEFADLGDKEYDPFVRKFMARDEHGRGHDHRAGVFDRPHSH
ncbi:MAG: hypothetical protein ABW321_00230 [Polyangiales bacterium]